MQTIACHICGLQTPMLGTKLCDRCWELQSRIIANPHLAKKIISSLNKRNSMIYSFNLPKNLENYISSDVAIDLNKIIFISPIINDIPGATFKILLSIKETITITCPSEAAEQLEQERQKLIAAWKSSI